VNALSTAFAGLQLCYFSHFDEFPPANSFVGAIPSFFFIQRFISQVAQPRHETLVHLVYLHYFENVSYPTQPQFPVNLGLTSLVL